jgi:hypothetical protein
MGPSSRRVARVLFSVAVICGSAARPANGQAWLPERGEGTVSLLYQDVFVKYHEIPGIGNRDLGQITGRSILADVTYGMSDKVAVSVGIPWAWSRYNGTRPHDLTNIPQQYWIPFTPIDDGAYHPTFQDFRFDVRYNVTKKGVVLTPFVGSIVPSHDYAYFGHSAVGRDLKELQVGSFAAKTLDALVPGLFVQGRYSYGFTERVLDVAHDRSNMDLEVGYFVTPKLRVLGLGNGQVTHGGPDLTLTWRQDLGALAPHHDQVTRDNFLNLGGGAAYALTDKIDVFASLLHTDAARNGHVIRHGLSAGLSWSFTTPGAKARAIAARHGYQCLCEKNAM